MAAERFFKGKSISYFPDSFVCIDIETTGFNTKTDDIIEISAIKIKNNQTIDTFSEVINIKRPLPPFIVSLTGITDKELSTGNTIENVLYRFCQFVGTEIIIGHNVNFDINFIYDKCLEKIDTIFENDYLDTLRIGKKLLPFLPHHKLDDLAEYYNIPPRTLHRALGDCEMTVSCYMKMKNQISNKDNFFKK